MDSLDKLTALEYIVKNNNLCNACNRADINEIRVAAGLYLELADIILSNEKSFTIDDLAKRIKKAGAF
jgi:ankyrin repeat protein